MNRKVENLLTPESECLSKEMLFRHAENRLSSAEVRRVEEHISDCPLCSDALDGILALSNSEVAKKTIGEIERNILRKKEIPKTRVVPLRRLMAVAAAVLVIAMGSWLVNSLIQKSPEKIFTDQFKPYPVPDSALHTEETPVRSDAEQLKSGDDLIKKEEPQQKFTEKKIPPSVDEEQLESRNVEDETTIADDNKNADAQLQDVAPVPSETITATEDADGEVVSPDFATVPQTTTSGNIQVQSESLTKDNVQTFTSTDKEKNLSLNEVVVSSGVSQLFDVREEDKVDPNIVSDSLSSAMQLYQANNFLPAIQKFDHVLLMDASNYEALFYSGVSYLALNQPDAAISRFKKIDNEKSKPFYEAILWYEALAYVNKEDKKNAENLLEKVIKLNGSFKSQAEETLDDLK